MSVLSQRISSYFRPRLLHVSCRGTRWVVLSTPCPSTIPASLWYFHLEESNSRRLVTQNHHHHKREARREHDRPQSNTGAQARMRGVAQNSGRLFCRCHWRPRNRCHNTDDVSWRSLCFSFFEPGAVFSSKLSFPNSNKEPLPISALNCKIVSPAKLPVLLGKSTVSVKVGLQPDQACANIMYTTHRSIHLVPMKYREWAGHSASLTSLFSAIRLSAIMALCVSRGPFLGCVQNPVVQPPLEPSGIS